MTQQRLARIIGVAFQQAHKYERGLSRVSAGRLFHIALALQASIGYFCVDDDIASPSQGGKSQRSEGDDDD